MKRKSDVEDKLAKHLKRMGATDPMFVAHESCDFLKRRGWRKRGKVLMRGWGEQCGGIWRISKTRIDEADEAVEVVERKA